MLLPNAPCRVLAAIAARGGKCKKAARKPLRNSVLPDITFHLLLLLCAAAFFAGFVDSIAGGGGLISVPAMLIAGIPPLQTLGTNKVQSIFGAASATLAYARKGHVQLREQLPMALMAVMGGALGAALAARTGAAGDHAGVAAVDRDLLCRQA